MLNLVGLLKLLLGWGWNTPEDTPPGHLETISNATACLERIIAQHS